MKSQGSFSLAVFLAIGGLARIPWLNFNEENLAPSRVDMNQGIRDGCLSGSLVPPMVH
jgi:hypothetical protein